MSLYGDVKDIIDADSSEYVKIQSGKKVRVRAIDHPYISMRQFSAGDKPTMRFTWPVWDYEANRVKLLEQGGMVYTQIAAIVDEYGEDMPMKADLVISRTGDGKENTRYNVVAGPVKEDLPENVHELMPAMAEAVPGGVPLAKYRDGERPVVQTAEGKEVLEEIISEEPKKAPK